jgi:outer membrane protein assembly factor BamB
MAGFRGTAMAFKLGGSGNVTATNRLWALSKHQPERIGTGVVVGKYLYVANAGPSTAQCLELATGKERWHERLPEGKQGGLHWGSIVYAGGRLYVTNQSGATHVFPPNPDKLDLVASNKLGEPSNATPAVSDGRIFIRTDGHLYCIGE